MLLNEGVDRNHIARETLEGDQLIVEAILEDHGVELTEEQIYDLVSEQLLSERSIVRLDKKAHRARAEKKAAIIMAKEANDPIYKKLVKVYKLRRKYLGIIVQKYGARAKARVRRTFGKKKVAAAIKNAGRQAVDQSKVYRGKDIPAKR